MKHTVDIRRTCNKYKRNLMNAYTSKKYICFDARKKYIYKEKRCRYVFIDMEVNAVYSRSTYRQSHTRIFIIHPPPFLDTNSHLETHAA